MLNCPAPAICTACGETKPRSYTHFAFRHDRSWPYSRICRECQKTQRRLRNDSLRLESGYIAESKPIGAACDACGSVRVLRRDMHDGRIKGTLCKPCAATINCAGRDPSVIKERLEGVIFYLDLVDSK